MVTWQFVTITFVVTVLVFSVLLVVINHHAKRENARYYARVNHARNAWLAQKNKNSVDNAAQHQPTTTTKENP